MRFHQNSSACGYVLRRLFVTNLENDPCFSMEATHIPAKLWGKILTKHGSRHLVWMAKNEGGGFLFKRGSLWHGRYIGTFLAAWEAAGVKYQAQKESVGPLNTQINTGMVC